MLVTGTRKYLFIKTDNTVHLKQPEPTTGMTQRLCVACKDGRCYPGFCVPLLCLAQHSLSYVGGVLCSAANAPGYSSLNTGVMMTLAVCQTPSKRWYPRKGPPELADPSV